MKRLSPRKLALAALVLAVAAGAVAAFAAGGSGGKAKTHARNRAATPVSDVQLAHRRAHRTLLPTLAAAARYLGTSAAKLRSDLRAGKSMAQIAKETPGKSEAGLIAAVEHAHQKKLTKAQERLDKRIAAQVHTPGGRVRRRVLSLREDARVYLGLSTSKLRAAERAGKSLGQITRETPGKSEAGLEQAIVNARKQQLEAAVKAGAMSPRSERLSVTHLQQRVHRFVDRVQKLSRSRLSGAPSTS